MRDYGVSGAQNEMDSSDDIDLAILAILQEDTTCPSASIGSRVKVSHLLRHLHRLISMTLIEELEILA